MYLIVLFVFGWNADEVCAQKFVGPPYVMPWRAWAHYILNKRITNLTYELLKDANSKLAITETIREPYEGQLSMQLGMVSASIQDLYARMLAIYRRYNNLADFRKTVPLYQHLDGFHIIQSLFNQIRMEQKMFFEMIHKKQLETRQIKKIQKTIAGLNFRRQMEGPEDLAMSQIRNRNTRRNLQNEDKKVPSDLVQKNLKRAPKFNPKIDPTDFDVGPFNLNLSPDPMEVEDMKNNLINTNYKGFKIENELNLNDEEIRRNLQFKAESHIQRIDEVISNTYGSKMIPEKLTKTLNNMNKEFDEKNEKLYNFKRAAKINIAAEKKAALDRFKYLYDEDQPNIDPSNHPMKNGRRNKHSFKGLPVDVTKATTKKQKWRRGATKK